MATSDPERAAQIARTITGHFQAEALIAVAEVVAHKSPDQAAQIARTITDPDQRAEALTTVAEVVLACTDPNQAKQLVTEAEQLTRSILNSSQEVLTAIANVMANTDPKQAEKIARSITETPWQQNALAAIAKLIASTAPKRAEKIARSLTDPAHQVTAIAEVIRAVAPTDPTRATRLTTKAQKLARTNQQKEALTTLAKAVAYTAPDQAEKIARSLTDPAHQVTAIAEVIRAVAPTDPTRATRLTTKAQKLASKISDDPGQTSALLTVAEAVAETNPDRAEQIAWSITTDASGGHAWRRAVLIVTAVARRDSTHAAQLARRISDDRYQSSMLVRIAEVVAGTDPDHAIELVNEAEQLTSSSLLADRRSVTDAITRQWDDPANPPGPILRTRVAALLSPCLLAEDWFTVIPRVARISPTIIAHVADLIVHLAASRPADLGMVTSPRLRDTRW